MKQKKTRQSHILLTTFQKTKLKEISARLNITQSVLIRCCLNQSLRELESALLSNKLVVLDEELIINNE